MKKPTYSRVTIPFNGILIRAEESTDNMYASIDKVLDKLERQIHKYRTKLERSFRTGAFVDDKMVFSKGEYRDQGDEELKIVRTKRFAVKPMSIEEALMQMDLLGHSFFVFSNADTDELMWYINGGTADMALSNRNTNN